MTVDVGLYRVAPGAVVFLDVQQNENSWKYHGAGVPCASASCLDLREIHQKKARTKLMVLNAVLL